MKTSLSTARIRVSSARDTPMPLPISELFHGTMTSDFGASWLPRIDMPASAFGSLAAACVTGAVATVCAAEGAVAAVCAAEGAVAAVCAAEGAVAASWAESGSATLSNHALATIFCNMLPPLRARAPCQIGDPNRRLRVFRHQASVHLVMA